MDAEEPANPGRAERLDPCSYTLGTKSYTNSPDGQELMWNTTIPSLAALSKSRSLRALDAPILI